MVGLLPALNEENEAFWTGGSDGQLKIMACANCDLRIHPPQIICPNCQSRDVAPVVSSGLGKIASYTINHQAWLPDLSVPFALAIVELDDQPGVRITARLETDEFESVEIGSSVSVHFEQREDVFIPYFQLA